ncbi:hypothetical protein Goari_006365 [Gossypium aridum]|uniref:Uncharacterized protein n=1 Tax=Gossypium aridum TaxID=34290 RepID=A0A7J8XNE1_GOSAI|nr:hypothetical protein [Gossypium aridum]
MKEALDNQLRCVLVVLGWAQSVHDFGVLRAFTFFICFSKIELLWHFKYCMQSYVRYAMRQKRAETKRALRNLLFNSDASTISFQVNFSGLLIVSEPLSY